MPTRTQPRPLEVRQVIRRTAAGWHSHITHATYLYARALTTGMLQPITHPGHWHRAPAALAIPAWRCECPGTRNIVLDQITWTAGIGLVHSLAAGYVEPLVPGTEHPLGSTSPWAPWRVHSRTLALAGIDLDQFGAAFHGDVLAAATAVLAALDNGLFGEHSTTADDTPAITQPRPQLHRT